MNSIIATSTFVLVCSLMVICSGRAPSICKSPVRCTCSGGAINCRNNQKLKRLPDMSNTGFLELYLTGSAVESVTCARLPRNIEMLDIRNCPKLSVAQVCALRNCAKLSPSRALYLHSDVQCQNGTVSSTTVITTEVATVATDSVTATATATSAPPALIKSTLSPSTVWASTTATTKQTDSSYSPRSDLHSTPSPTAETKSTAAPTTTALMRPKTTESTLKISKLTHPMTKESLSSAKSQTVTIPETTASVKTWTTTTARSSSVRATHSGGPTPMILTNPPSTVSPQNAHVTVEFTAADAVEKAVLLLNHSELSSESRNVSYNATFSAQNDPKPDKSGVVVGLSVFGSLITVVGLVGGLVLFYWHRKRMEAQARHYTITMQNLFGQTLSDLERRKRREESRAEARRRAFQGHRLSVSNELSAMGVPPSTSAAGPSSWVSFSDEVLNAVNGSQSPSHQVTVSAEVYAEPPNDVFHSFETSTPQNVSQESSSSSSQQSAAPFENVDLGVTESTV